MKSRFSWGQSNVLIRGLPPRLALAAGGASVYPQDIKLELSTFASHPESEEGPPPSHRLASSEYLLTHSSHPSRAVSRPQGLREVAPETGIKYLWLLRLPRFSASFLLGEASYSSPPMEHWFQFTQLGGHGSTQNAGDDSTGLFSALPGLFFRPRSPSPRPSALLTGTSAPAAPALLPCHPQWPAFYRRHSQ